jgi:hypothetical protein
MGHRQPLNETTSTREDNKIAYRLTVGRYPLRLATFPTVF